MVILRLLPGGTTIVNPQLMRRVMQAYLKSLSFANFVVYKRIRSSCTKILKKQKRLGWQKLCIQFNFKTLTSEVWLVV